MLLVFALLLALVPHTFSAVNAADEKTLTLASGTGDIPTIDPVIMEDTASQQIATETMPTLVKGLETDLTQVSNIIASDVKVSKDGKTYTFTLREDIPWVSWDGKEVVQALSADGKPRMVNAHDFEFGIKRLLNPVTAASYAYLYTEIIEGGSAFNSSKETGDALKKLEDAVAVKATGDFTLEVKVTEARAYLLGVFGIGHMVAMPQEVLEKYAEKWTEPGNAWSYGPYVVSEWKHDESLSMVKNPFWKGVDGAPAAKIDKVTFLMIDESAAFSNYEAGSIDAVSVPLPEIDRVKADPVLSKELTIAPVFCTYYYGFNVTKAPFDDARVRRAFSMAVDRQDLIDNVTKGGQEPARWFARPGLAAAPTMENSADLGIASDVEGAKKELQSYLDEKGITIDKLPPIALTLNQVEGHVKIAEAIQQMWKENLGVDVTVSTQEWKVFLSTLDTDPPQIYRLGWCVDYPDASNFDRDVFRSTSTNNHTKWVNADYDKLVDQAAAESDPAKRLEMYKQAEEILVKTDAAIIPLYWYTRVGVTKPYVERTFAVGGGDERFEKWDIKK